MDSGIRGQKFDVRTFPECWIFLQDVLIVTFCSHFKGKKIIPGLILNRCSGVIVSVHNVPFAVLRFPSKYSS